MGQVRISSLETWGAVGKFWARCWNGVTAEQRPRVWFSVRGHEAMRTENCVLGRLDGGSWE